MEYSVGFRALRSQMTGWQVLERFRAECGEEDVSGRRGGPQSGSVVCVVSNVGR
jgi:hypothetical protein